MHETLARLESQRGELERLAEQMEANPASIDVEAQKRRTEAIQDPAERDRLLADIVQAQMHRSDQQAMNLVMRRVIDLEMAVIYLSARMERVEQALSA
jgi:hypothetical protein